MSKLWIIIPTHNRRESLEFLLNKIQSSDYKWKSLQIIVIADNCNHQTRDLLINYKNIKTFYTEEDYWWTKSVNLGLQYISSRAQIDDSILLLNDDVDFNCDYFINLYSIHSSDRNSIIGSLNVYVEDSITKVYSCGGKYDLIFAKNIANIKLGTHLDKINKLFYKTDYIYGRGMLIPFSVFNKIGYFDCMSLPQYMSDDDYCLVAKKNSISCIISCKSIIFNDLNTTSHYKLNLLKPLLFLKSLVSIKSQYNLKFNYNFAMKNSKIPFYFFFLSILELL